MSTRGEQALSFLKVLSFPRTSGSAKEYEAAGLILEEIKKTGFEPVVEEFEVCRRNPVSASFKLTDPEKISYSVTGLIDAASTPKDGIEADFYHLKHIDDISLKRAAGKFVLLNNRPGEKEYEKLIQAGIKGFLLLNGTIRDTAENSDLDTLRFREMWQRYGAVPAFAIRIRDALDLLKRAPKRVHFTLQTKEEKAISRNIVVTVPGTDLAAETLAAGAHYDSTEFSHGAWDNGAGVVEVLALLRHLAINPPRRTVKAIFFGSEEVGLKGSRAYLEAHPDQQNSLLAMVNIDVGGSYLGHPFVAVTGTKQAEDYIAGLLKEAGHSAGLHSRVMSSDSAVFSDYGIPAVFFGQQAPRGGGYMHTRYDEISLISADVLDEEIYFLLFLFDRLTNAEIFPIERVIPKELRQKIVEYFGTGLSHTETVKDFPEETKAEQFII